MSSFPFEAKNLLNYSRIYFPSNVPQESVKALFVPHASLEYSGVCAASAYHTIPIDNSFDTVIVLATWHDSTSRELAMCQTDFSESELMIRSIKNIVNVTYIPPEEILKEHAFTHQLPFLIERTPNTNVIPILVKNTPVQVDSLLVEISQKMKKGKTLLICTSDLSHVHDKISHDELKTKDNIVLDYLSGEDRRTSPDHLSACGSYAIDIFCKILKTLEPTMKLYSRVQCYYNSTQVKNHPLEWYTPEQLVKPFSFTKTSYTVTYASLIFSDTPYVRKQEGNQLACFNTKFEQSVLLEYSRQTLLSKPYVVTRSKNQQEVLGVFVTLKTGTRLRGCLGSVDGTTSILSAIQTYTVKSQNEDPRFQNERLTNAELSHVTIQISLLAPRYPITSKTFFNDFQIGKQGVEMEIVYFSKETGERDSSAVYLPSVILEQQWSKEELLKHLQEKTSVPPMATIRQRRLYVMDGLCFPLPSDVLLLPPTIPDESNTVEQVSPHFIITNPHAFWKGPSDKLGDETSRIRRNQFVNAETHVDLKNAETNEIVRVLYSKDHRMIGLVPTIHRSEIDLNRKRNSNSFYQQVFTHFLEKNPSAIVLDIHSYPISHTWNNAVDKTVDLVILYSPLSVASKNLADSLQRYLGTSFSVVVLQGGDNLIMDSSATQGHEALLLEFPDGKDNDKAQKMIERTLYFLEQLYQMEQSTEKLQDLAVH